jgi:predicted nucleic acid-binding protein
MPTATAGDAGGVALLDTSVAVALLIADHESHSAVMETVRGRVLGLAGHAWFETYSVLTRFPGSRRRSPAEAGRLLAKNFPASAFLGDAETRELAGELARLGISGGAVYDGLVAGAARQHGRPLLTRDARARMVYDRLGVEVEPIP